MIDAIRGRCDCDRKHGSKRAYTAVGGPFSAGEDPTVTGRDDGSGPFGAKDAAIPVIGPMAEKPTIPFIIPTAGEGTWEPSGVVVLK